MNTIPPRLSLPRIPAYPIALSYLILQPERRADIELSIFSFLTLACTITLTASSSRGGGTRPKVRFRLCSDVHATHLRGRRGLLVVRCVRQDEVSHSSRIPASVSEELLEEIVLGQRRMSAEFTDLEAQILREARLLRDPHA